MPISDPGISADALVDLLNGLLAQGRYGDLEQASRDALAQHRFYLWHQYLILALLRTGRREEAGRELDDLFSYKFNLADRAWPEIRDAFPEKFESGFILSTMKPELGLETQTRLARHWDVPYPLDDPAEFARVVDELVAAVVPALPAMSRETTRITTFGSCFAANLAKAMKAGGVDAANLLIEESINSPLANRELLEAIAQGPAARYFDRISEAFGSEFIDRARSQLQSADVLVITLGVAPSMFHVGSEEFAFLVDYRDLLRKKQLFMRTPGVEEMKRVIDEVLGLARTINPSARIYVSISPVPLMGTIELAHTVLADCVSKSTLRAALHESIGAQQKPDVHYWPAFEIVRWLGAHTSLAIFGADDRVSRHVSNWAVDMIVERFGRHLFGAPASSASPQAPAATPAK